MDKKVQKLLVTEAETRFSGNPISGITEGFAAPASTWSPADIDGPWRAKPNIFTPFTLPDKKKEQQLLIFLVTDFQKTKIRHQNNFLDRIKRKKTKPIISSKIIKMYYNLKSF